MLLNKKKFNILKENILCQASTTGQKRKLYPWEEKSIQQLLRVNEIFFPCEFLYCRTVSIIFDVVIKAPRSCHSQPRHSAWRLHKEVYGSYVSEL